MPEANARPDRAQIRRTQPYGPGLAGLGRTGRVVIPLRDDNPTSRFPILTVLLIAANIFIFAFVQPHGTQAEALFTYEHAAIPCELDQGKPVTSPEVRSGICDR